MKFVVYADLLGFIVRGVGLGVGIRQDIGELWLFLDFELGVVSFGF